MHIYTSFDPFFLLPPLNAIISFETFTAKFVASPPILSILERDILRSHSREVIQVIRSSIREEKRREKISLNRNWRSTDGQAGNKVLSCTRYYWTREEGRLRVIDGNATNSTDIPMA